EQVSVNDAQDLAELGLKVRFLCLEGSPVHQQLLGKKGVVPVPLSYRPVNHFDFQLRSELLKLWKSGVNLIHPHQTSYLASLIPWFWNKNDIVILASRHLMNDSSKKNPYHALLYRRLDA